MKRKKHFDDTTFADRNELSELVLDFIKRGYKFETLFNEINRITGYKYPKEDIKIYYDIYENHLVLGGK